MSQSFTVMPMSQQMSLQAGKTYRGSITVSNPAESTDDFYYAASVSPYNVINNEYEADLSTKSDYSMITDWITIEEPTGHVRPNNTKQLNFLITVPENAPAGGQYAAINVRSNAPKGADGGAILQDVYEFASIIYADIAGETVHAGEVTENHIPGFATALPVSVSALITNTGNVHENAYITIKVKNIITGDTVYPTDDQTGEFAEIIMPETTRLISRELTGLSQLGLYEVTHDIEYLGETHYNTGVLMVCPLWFLILVVVTLGTIIGTVAARIVRRRSVRKLAKS